MTLLELHEFISARAQMTNFHLFDTNLATYVTKDIEGDPLWMNPIAPSGWGKTFLARLMESLGDVVIIDQLTSKAFSSGTRNDDLGHRINRRRVLLLIPDMASLQALPEEEKKQILSVFRTMFDGRIIRNTGVNDADYVVHCNLIGMCVPELRRDISFASVMGSREILYELPDFSVDYERKINPDDMVAMRDHVSQFIAGIPTGAWTEPTREWRLELVGYAQRMAFWRVEAIANDDGYLLEKPKPEVPRRLYNQLVKLWMGLKKIGVDDNEIRAILNEMEAGVGNPLRKSIYDYLTTDYDGQGRPYEAPRQMEFDEIVDHFNIAKSEVRTQLMVLRSLDLATKNDEDGWTGILDTGERRE